MYNLNFRQSYSRIAKVLVFAVVGLFALALAQPVNAIEYGGVGGKPAYPKSSNPRTESIFIYEISPGGKETDAVQIVNNSNETKTLLVYSTDSQKSTDGGFACEQLSDTADKVGSWVKLAKTEVVLAPISNQIVDFTVNVPANADVGEHNGCVIIQEKDQSKVDSGVSITTRSGIRVAVTVPGKVIRSLSVQDFKVELKDDKINAHISILNSGNVSIDAKVKIVVDYFFGLKHHLVDNQYSILREDTATYNIEIPRPFWGGAFKVYATVEYDASEDAVVGKDTENPKTLLNSQVLGLWVTPQPVALGVEGLILAGILLIAYYVFVVSGRKRYEHSQWVKYEVRRSDDINSLASKYRVSWKELASVNGLSAPYLLKEGMTIKVPRLKS